MRLLFQFILAWALCAPLAMGASIDARGSKVNRGFFGQVKLNLATDEVTGLRVRYAQEPNRVILRFDDLDMSALPEDFFDKSRPIAKAEIKDAADGDRLILTMRGAYHVKMLDFSPTALDGETGLRLELEEISDDEYQALVASLENPNAAPDLAVEPRLNPGKRLIVIDPGHGGRDPGATRHGVKEKTITLQASRLLKEKLEETGRYQVVLTRSGDDFLSLLERRQFAERLGADVFLSIHADTVEIGNARGTTIYKLSDRATSEIAAHFARFENRVDLFGGEVAAKNESDLSVVLTDMAHVASRQNADLLAQYLQQSWQTVNTIPEESRVESAAFAVLKAPEIPSLLLEIGYLSNDDDIARIRDPIWLDEMALGLRSALDKYFQAVE